MDPFTISTADVTASVSPVKPPKPTPRDDPDYDALRHDLQTRFLAIVGSGGPLFTTDAEGLFDAYLAAFPASERQYHNCNACRRFLETYGGLVTIGEHGQTESAIWSLTTLAIPDTYVRSLFGIAARVRSAKVTGVFLSKEAIWGNPTTPPWTHFAVTPPASLVHRSVTQSAGQAMAEKLEDYKNVQRALAEWTRPTIETALKLLESEALYRSEKVIGPAKWLYFLHVQRNHTQNPARDNLVWRAVAHAPAGFCHPRASMIGTLLDDIAAGMDFTEVSRRFAAKMSPLQYQRPQAPPSVGSIVAAEKLVETMGIRPSLDRRFARLDEVEAIWKPRPRAEAPASGGVFSHLKPKGAVVASSMQVPPITMTWVKFAATVLPIAETLAFFTAMRPNSYVGLLTAVHADAPPILQWDTAEYRNPVSWYLYSHGSIPSAWDLPSNVFHPVNAVTLKPNQWRGGFCKHQGEGVILILDGAKDVRESGNALFPEILKSELHGVRAVIEAYSRSAVIGGKEEASANGIMLGKGSTWDALIRVGTAGGHQDYRLDRWD